MYTILQRWATAYLGVNGFKPIFVWHVDLEYDIEVAFVVWGLVLRHTLSAKDDAVARLDDFAWWAGNVDTAAIQMGDENPRESEERFRQRNVDRREQVAARPFERLVRLCLQREDNITWRNTGLIWTLKGVIKRREMRTDLLVACTRKDDSLPIRHTTLNVDFLPRLLFDGLGAFALLTPIVPFDDMD